MFYIIGSPYKTLHLSSDSCDINKDGIPDYFIIERDENFSAKNWKRTLYVIYGHDVDSSMLMHVKVLSDIHLEKLKPE
jgi:hypothetical protein